MKCWNKKIDISCEREWERINKREERRDVKIVVGLKIEETRGKWEKVVLFWAWKCGWGAPLRVVGTYSFSKATWTSSSQTSVTKAWKRKIEDFGCCVDRSEGLTHALSNRLRYGVGGSRVASHGSRRGPGFLSAKYAEWGRPGPGAECGLAPRVRASPTWTPLAYTLPVTHLVIRSVFAAYFDCEILHLAFVWRQAASLLLGRHACGGETSERADRTTHRIRPPRQPRRP